MKKLFKGLFTFVLAFVCILSFSACTQKISKTTVDTSKVEKSNGVSTNGGITAIYNGYLYFINGTKTNDGTSSSKNTRSAICRVKYDQSTGEVTDSTYEVVVDDLVGFTYGSLYFFGNFMYYTTPSSDVNYKADVLYYKTKFMRYDLVNKTKQTIYTTQQNASSETTSYAYYIVGEELNLVVYESQNSTITSVKIGDTFKTNYVIENVTSCIFSENNGKSISDGTDANNYVFYTKSNETYDKYQTGTKVLRTLPNTNSSYTLSDEGLSITLLCIRNGKLVYSYDARIYAISITGDSTEKLSTDNKYVISYETYDDVIFIENDDGSISVLYYDSDEYQVVVIKWIDGVELESTTINVLSKSESFAFVGVWTIEEAIATDAEDEENEENEESEDAEEDDAEENADDSDEEVEVKTDTVKYLIYLDSNIAYKLEIERNGVISEHSQPVKLSKTSVSSPEGTISPELIGNYLFALGNEVNDSDKETGNVYLFKIDITISEDSAEYAKMVGIEE
jgi:hypothetical protein